MTFNFLYGKVCLFVCMFLVFWFLCVCVFCLFVCLFCGEGVGVASLVIQLVKNHPAMQETLVHFLGHKDLWRRDRLPTPVFLGLLPWWLRWSRIHLQYRRPGFDPWVEKIPWRRTQLATPVYLPGEFHGERRLASYSP